MKPKKSNQADLETKKGMFRQMGIVIALSLVFIAFEYSNADVSNNTLDYTPDIVVEIDHIPITRSKPTLPPPPPPAILNTIIIDPLNLSMEDDLVIVSSEIDETNDVLYTPEEIDEIDDDAIFITPEQMPEFPGGETALFQFLRENVNYPTIASEMGIQGRVYVEFVIDKSGHVTNIKLLKGVDKHLDNEALRVINLMPNWTPGYQGGKAVNVSYRLPINFKQQ